MDNNLPQTAMATLTAGFMWAPEDAPVTKIPTKKVSHLNVTKIPTNMLIFDQDDYVDHMGEGADDNHDNHDCVCPAKTSERSHNLNNNEDEKRKVKRWKIPTMTPIPDENAFASREPLEAGSPLG